jgi:TIGR03009 family protein
MLRYLLPALTIASIAVSSAFADPQSPPKDQPKPLSPEQKAKALEQCAAGWEQAMKGMKAFEAQLDRVEQDRAARSEEKYTGVAKFMEPNYLLLELKKTDNQDVYEKWLSTGTFLYQWVPQAKKINVNELPKLKGSGNESMLAVLGCLKIDEARKRFDLDYVKEDDNYHYIEIKPKSPEDKAEFTWARLVLNKKTNLPREIRFITPSNDEVLWNIRSLQVYASTDKMNRIDFAKPDLPKDWKWEQSPRVVRPQQ